VALSEELRASRTLEAAFPYGIHSGLEDPPAVRAVDEIVETAIAARASDIHFDPLTCGGRVRERVDGMLREVRRLDDSLFTRVVSRIKLLAGMDIADRRSPQDGQWAFVRRGTSVEARVSSMPTVWGETLSVRLLSEHANVPELEHLGMGQSLLERYRALVDAPSGFVVVCGPTGSGKTTTLYASLRSRNGEAQHLCTIEDPVEIRLGGVAQVQVNPRAGLTFSSALRSMLRQDPDAIMIGEMRDAETAVAAIAAALSGRLVLTTLHSRSALQAIERLVELGVRERKIAAALTGIVAQRLLRQLCPHCKKLRPAGTVRRFRIAAESHVYEAVGCERCNGTGYRGRSAVFELVTMSEALRQAVSSARPCAQLRKAASLQGYVPMAECGAALVSKGETTIEELVRVLDAPEAA
jgi:type IV pilus assembly protein PilB